jgi:hypothetical protein
MVTPFEAQKIGGSAFAPLRSEGDGSGPRWRSYQLLGYKVLVSNDLGVSAVDFAQ